MPVSRRIADALASPRRAWSFGRGVVRLLTQRKLKSVWSRLRPRSFDADEYWRWVRTIEPGIPLPRAGMQRRWLILVDAGEAKGDALARAVSSVAAPGASHCVASLRTDARGWTVPLALDRVGDALHAGTRRSALRDIICCEDARSCEWILWISEPASLAPGALEALNEAAGADVTLVYGDDDRMEPSGRRCDPDFRPAWDVELARAGDIPGPLIAMPASLLSRSACSDAIENRESVALVLAVASHADPDSIVHVPRVLAHRAGARAHARSSDAAPRLASADKPRASLVIPSRDRPELLRRCVASIVERTSYGTYEFVFVDNDSTDPAMPQFYREVLAAHAGRVVRVSGEFNFPRLCNAGAAAAEGALLVMLNNDTVIDTAGWLDELADVVGQPDVGAAGGLLLYENGRIQHAGILLGVNGVADNALANFDADDRMARAWCASRRTVSAVLGACLALRRDVYREAGGMDEMFAVSHNEIDLCLRLAERGLRTVFTPYAVLTHAESATRGYDVTDTQRAIRDAESALFAQRWRERLARCDPAYHPVFSTAGSQFRLALKAVSCVPRRRSIDGRRGSLR